MPRLTQLDRFWQIHRIGRTNRNPIPQRRVYRHKRIESYIGFEHVFCLLACVERLLNPSCFMGFVPGSVMHRTLAPRQDGAMHQVSFAFIKGFT